MVVVVDNSYLVPLFLPDEDAEVPERLLRLVGDQGFSMMVPSLWVSEFGNVMLMALRRGRLTAEQHAQALGQALQLPLSVQPFPGLHDFHAVSELASRHRLSFYDATYLALARERGGKVATLDEKLKQAATAEGLLF